MKPNCLIVPAATSICGCCGLPEGVEPVKDFDLNRHLGKWYEIARLDHPFERGLGQGTAEYSLRDDGGVCVINRGFSVEARQWREIEGKADFVRDSDAGYRKVSFFGPFYGADVIFELDEENYRYASVSGPSKSCLWLSARTPAVSEARKERFIRRAQALGFHTDEMILVAH